MNQTATLPLWAWVCIAVLLLAQGAWIFRDAQKRGARGWLWGLYGLTNFPSSLIVYYLLVISPTRRNAKKSAEMK